MEGFLSPTADADRAPAAGLAGGGAITERARWLDLQVRADVRPSADIIADGVCSCLWFADSPGGIGATLNSECGVFHVERNR